jgi:hypothetical protein
VKEQNSVEFLLAFHDLAVDVLCASATVCCAQAQPVASLTRKSMVCIVVGVPVGYLVFVRLRFESYTLDQLHAFFAPFLVSSSSST